MVTKITNKNWKYRWGRTSLTEVANFLQNSPFSSSSLYLPASPSWELQSQPAWIQSCVTFELLLTSLFLSFLSYKLWVTRVLPSEDFYKKFRQCDWQGVNIDFLCRKGGIKKGKEKHKEQTQVYGKRRQISEKVSLVFPIYTHTWRMC